MRIASKATKGKGKRWKKGDSSSSNPSTRKFRSMVKSSGFQINADNKNQARSLLTEDILAQHNAIQMNKLNLNQDNDNQSEPIEVDEQQFSSNESVGTFASVWSNCTNASFSKLLYKWNSSSPLHREMLAVLSAVSDTIHEKGGKENETEYFAALMTTLETAEHDEALTAIISLISMVMKRLPPTIIKVKFSETSKIFIQYLSRYIESDNGFLVRSLISCLGTLLKHQEAAVWHLTSTQQVYETILSLTIHNKPRTRKTACKIVAGILKNRLDHFKKNVCHPAAGLTCNFCIKKIQDLDMNENFNTALYVLNLLQHILSILSNSDIRRSCETILRLMTLRNPIVVSCALKVFHQLFYDQPNENLLTTELNAQMISALYDYQPNLNDIQPLITWIDVMKQAFLNLNRLNAKLSLNHLPKLLNAFVNCWLSDSNQVHICISDGIKTIFSNCIKESTNEIGKETMEKIISTVLNVLKYQYYDAFGQILNVVANILTSQHADLYLSTLSTLVDMRDENHFKYISELEYVFGCSVKLFGPRAVLDVCNVDLSGENDFSNTWLIPIIRDHLDKSELAFFVDYFMPAANELEKKLKFYQDEPSKAKPLETLYFQLWSLLPSFSLNPTDFCSTFKKIAKTLGTILSEKEQLRNNVLSALKNLLTKNCDKSEVKTELSKYGKNFIPILFNLYTSEKIEVNQRLKVYEVMQLYFTIIDQNLIDSLYIKVKQKINDSNNEYLQLAILDLLRIFIPFIKAKDLKELYDFAVTNIKGENHRNQKKGFLIVEEICTCNSTNSKQFLQNYMENIFQFLIQSLNICSESAKFALLRSLKVIIEEKSDEDLVKLAQIFPSFITKVIECLIVNRQRLVASSISLLFTMFQVSKKVNGHSFFIDYILGLLNTSENNFHLVSASVLALTKLLIQFNQELTQDKQKLIIEKILQLTQTDNRIVIKSVLEFMKCLLSSSQEYLMPLLTEIVQSLLNIKDKHKSHFRNEFKEMIIRLIRKFDYETVSKLIPTTNVYGKILRNIRKKELRKMNKDKRKETDASSTTRKKYESIDDIIKESDNSSEDEMDDFTKEKEKNKKKYWIDETTNNGEILDLTETKSFSNILSTDPHQNKHQNKKEQFPTTEDGKIIIGNSNDENRGSKRKLEESSESEEEEEFGSNLNDHEPLVYKHGGRGIHRDTEAQRFGKEYTSSRAKGDMKKKGMMDPYAYIPLDRQTLNKRKKAKFKGQFKNIVKSAKKGASQGRKINKRVRR